ncbi:MAG: hypothetical protein ACLQVX_10125 [Limisphaerales bacterium]
MRPEYELYDRREFFRVINKTAAIVGLTAAAAKNARADKADSSNPFAYDLSRLQKTDPALIRYEEASRWRAPRKDPKRIALGPDDRIYLCAGNYVSVLSRDGQAILEIALSGPASCATAIGDTIFAAARDHIEVFNGKGEPRAKWDSPGKKSWLTGLAATENDVFAADSGNRVVYRFDRSGKLVRRIGEKNSERNVPGFIVPSPYLGVELHRDGLLRVNNIGRHQVEAYTFDGEFEGAWGKPSGAIDGFCGCCNPVAVSMLPDGRIVTGEKGLPRVKVYSAGGEFESVVAGVESFPENAKACSDLNDCMNGGLDVAADSQGSVYIVDFVTSNVRVMKRKS